MPSDVSRRQYLGMLGVTALPASGALSRPIRDRTAPGTTWSRTYHLADDGDDTDRGLTRAVVPVDDGFVLAGVVRDTAPRAWIAGVDDAGRERWQRSPGAVNGYLVDGAGAPDGGTVLAGVTNRQDDSTEQASTDPWLVRVSADGDVVWSRTYQPEAPGGGATAIVRTADGYAVAGAVEVDGNERPWAVALDDGGTVRWRWHESTDGRTGRAGDVVPVGGGLVVGGSDEPVGVDQPAGRTEDAWATRLDESGAVEWRRRFERERGDRIAALTPAGDGVVALGRRGFATDDEGVGWLVALDGDGEVRWERTYSRPTWNWLRDITPVGDGYVLVGTRERQTADTRNAWLLRVDGDGREQWGQLYPDDAYTRGFDAVTTADDGILVGGDRHDDGRSSAWLAKVGGDPAQSPSHGVDLPSLPGWVGPFAGGTVLGGTTVGLAMRLRNRDRRHDSDSE